MNIDTASITELRDELAGLMGHTQHEPPGSGDPYWTHESSRDAIYEHPIPLTLDFVAAAMQETGWVWRRSDCWYAFLPQHATHKHGHSTADTGDELADRLRLLVKIRS